MVLPCLMAARGVSPAARDTARRQTGPCSCQHVAFTSPCHPTWALKALLLLPCLPACCAAADQDAALRLLWVHLLLQRNLPEGRLEAGPQGCVQGAGGMEDTGAGTGAGSGQQWQWQQQLRFGAFLPEGCVHVHLSLCFVASWTHRCVRVHQSVCWSKPRCVQSGGAGRP